MARRDGAPMSFFRMLGRGLAGARRSPLIQMVAISTIALSLLLVGVVALAGVNLVRLGRSWGQGVQMTVYLDDGIAPERSKQIASALAALPGVRSVRSVGSREAYARLKRSLGARAELLDGVEESFLPASLEVALAPGVAEVIRAHPAFERLKRAPGVEDVELSGGWVARLVGIERLCAEAGLGVGLLVLCACLYIVASTIRLGLFARKDEIEILKLVGATDGFVKGPFLVEGALQGLFGTALACGLLYGLYRLAAPHVSAALGDLLAAAPLSFFHPEELAIALASGALIGLLGSALAVGRYVEA